MVCAKIKNAGPDIGAIKIALGTSVLSIKSIMASVKTNGFARATEIFNGDTGDVPEGYEEELKTEVASTLQAINGTEVVALLETIEDSLPKGKDMFIAALSSIQEAKVADDLNGLIMFACGQTMYGGGLKANCRLVAICKSISDGGTWDQYSAKAVTYFKRWAIGSLIQIQEAQSGLASLVNETLDIDTSKLLQAFGQEAVDAFTGLSKNHYDAAVSMTGIYMVPLGGLREHALVNTLTSTNLHNVFAIIWFATLQKSNYEMADENPLSKKFAKKRGIKGFKVLKQIEKGGELYYIPHLYNVAPGYVTYFGIDLESKIKCKAWVNQMIATSLICDLIAADTSMLTTKAERKNINVSFRERQTGGMGWFMNLTTDVFDDARKIVRDFIAEEMEVDDYFEQLISGVGGAFDFSGIENKTSKTKRIEDDRRFKSDKRAGMRSDIAK